MPQESAALDKAIDNFSRYAPIISSVRTTDPLAKPTIKSALEYKRDGHLEVTYSPFDHVATNSRLVIVGITPGRAQATNALVAASQSLRRGDAVEVALRTAKLTASFSGKQMRTNLVRMLDCIGLNRLFGVASADELFTAAGEQVHFTSALRYPVFVDGENYNGTPHMIKTPILRTLIERYLGEEARMLPDAVWLPLCPKPAMALLHLVNLGHLRPQQILDGMPHPSGANGERVASFVGAKEAHLLSDKTNAQQLAAARERLTDKIDRLAKLGEFA
ncbi:hypothetical protein FA04_03060 [Ensifer adhaerens]|nr:hypothetical protein FA04_03060 [Ensifer adhaerens]